jgi:hypothetical protein
MSESEIRTFTINSSLPPKNSPAKFTSFQKFTGEFTFFQKFTSEFTSFQKFTGEVYFFPKVHQRSVLLSLASSFHAGSSLQRSVATLSPLEFQLLIQRTQFASAVNRWREPRLVELLTVERWFDILLLLK